MIKRISYSWRFLSFLPGGRLQYNVRLCGLHFFEERIYLCVGPKFWHAGMTIFVNDFFYFMGFVLFFVNTFHF